MDTRWNDCTSEYAKEKRREDEEMQRKLIIKGLSSWDLACFAAGGEENLLREIKVNSNRRFLERLDKKIRILEYEKRRGQEDPFPHINRLNGYYKELRKIKDQCYYLIQHSDGSEENILDREKFYKYSSHLWYEFQVSRTRRSIYRCSRLRRGIYDQLLIKFYVLRDKILLDLET